MPSLPENLSGRLGGFSRSPKGKSRLPKTRYHWKNGRAQRPAPAGVPAGLRRKSRQNPRRTAGGNFEACGPGILQNCQISERLSSHRPVRDMFPMGFLDIPEDFNDFSHKMKHSAFLNRLINGGLTGRINCIIMPNTVIQYSGF
jgi:hypothetical protein